MLEKFNVEIMHTRPVIILNSRMTSENESLASCEFNHQIPAKMPICHTFLLIVYAMSSITRDHGNENEKSQASLLSKAPENNQYLASKYSTFVRRTQNARILRSYIIICEHLWMNKPYIYLPHPLLIGCCTALGGRGGGGLEHNPIIHYCPLKYVNNSLRSHTRYQVHVIAVITSGRVEIFSFAIETQPHFPAPAL